MHSAIIFLLLNLQLDITLNAHNNLIYAYNTQIVIILEKTSELKQLIVLVLIRDREESCSLKID